MFHNTQVSKCCSRLSARQVCIASTYEITDKAVEQQLSVAARVDQPFTVPAPMNQVYFGSSLSHANHLVD